MNFRFQFNRAIEFYKRNGLLKTTKKIIIKIKNKLFNSSEARKIEQQENENYQIWIKENEPTIEELENQKKYKFEYEPKISVIVPMYNTKEKYLKELIESLINQTYSNWELCLADGSDRKNDYVEALVTMDNRIKYKFLNENKGISENSNSALELATGDYIALLDHDDLLPAFSLFEIVKTINDNKEAEFIYTDEDKLLEEKENRIGPHFKPDYAPDTLMSYNYICHFSIFKKELMDKLGGFRKEFDGSQDYDLIFRAVEQANQVIHIPKILYHWRMNADSVALSSDAKPYAYEAAKRVIAAHLERIGVKAKVEDSTILGIYKVTYEVVGEPKVSIIIPNKDHKKDLKRCIDSIVEKTTYKNYEIIIVENNSQSNEIFNYYKEIKKNKRIKIVKYSEKGFNYSKINNFGVEHSTGDYIVLLNNDTKIITENWIETMLGNCQREDVGIVGAKLLYDNQTVQHAGVVLGLTGVAGHINAGLEENDPGYMARNIICQNYSAVTGAMLMISKKDYEEIGGLDENFPVAYNDVDLCLKIREKNKVVVMNPFVEAYHFESKTRGYEISEEKIKRLEKDSNRLKNKWKKYFDNEDPYFNPNFRHDIGTMRVKINNPQKEDKKGIRGKKTILDVIFAILIIIMFFTYEVTITYDSSHYLWLTSLLTTSNGIFENWDVARGPIFPLFIKVCNKLFGKTTNGLLIGMFSFYTIMIYGCYLIYKDTIKSEKYLSKKIKALFIVLFILLIAVNPMIFGYYHTLLTEFVGITFAIISCYLSWKLMNINFNDNKLKYIGYTLVLAILTAIAWQLKQPYVGTILFPVIISSIISFVRETKFKNLIQRLITLVICGIALIVGIQSWNFTIKYANVKVDETRTSEGFFASGIINGIKAYDTEDNENFDTVEKIEENKKISEEDKLKMIDVLEEKSQYKSFRVIDMKEDQYKVLYAKEDAISTVEAFKFWLETFKENPNVIIESYVSNYFATISIYPISFDNSRIIITKEFNWTDTTEISAIGYRIYEKGLGNVFYLPDKLAIYGAEYENINEPITVTNYFMKKLILPDTVIMKISYLLLPILTIISIIAVFITKNRYQKQYCRIIDMITILFTFSIMHILVHSLLGSTIDRYTMPALATTFMGILLSTYAIIYRKKYKI